MEKALLEELREIKSLIRDKTKDRWMDIKELSNYSSLSKSTIHRAVRKGRLKCSKSTGKLLFKSIARDNWLEAK